MSSKINSVSAQDAEHRVERGSINATAQDAERRVVRGSRKSQTSRANGAKSRGPVTPEGRAASSRNSIRHGLTAKSLVLPGESLEDYQFLLDSYIDQFDPDGGVEMELVHAMAAARWRLRRICAIETMLLNNEMLRRTDEIDADFEEHDFINVESIDRLTFAFQKLADNGQSLALLVRYDATLNRSHDRAFKQLLLLRSARNRPRPNEPKAGVAPSPALVTVAPVIRTRSNADHRTARDSKRMPGSVTSSPDDPSPNDPSPADPLPVAQEIA